MSNRWGRPVQAKGTLRTPGQNNINININFNASKDKVNSFMGKKIDNFIEINNEPKNNVTRPNVSMQTLKMKKKKNKINEDVVVQHELKRKKSKSKIINDVFTPEKQTKIRQSGNSRSISKVSTKKRTAKSYQNLRKYYNKESPRIEQKQQYQDTSQQLSRPNSRSKSKSRSESNKKLIKNGSKSKFQSASINTKTKSTNHQSKKSLSKKTKPETIEYSITRKASAERLIRNKPSINPEKKVKTRTKQKSQKQVKSSLKRLPLYDQDEDHYIEEGSENKFQNQTYKFFCNEKTDRKKRSKTSQKKKKETPFDRYLQQLATHEDLRALQKVAIIIQKNWRGYQSRVKFLKQLNAISSNIQQVREKIAKKDSKFWDDAQSDSILKADDESSLSELNSNIERQIESNILNPIQISDKSSLNQKLKISKKRMLDYSDHDEMMDKIQQLQQFLRKQQQKSQKLEQQNLSLKVNLMQKPNIQSMSNSDIQSSQLNSARQESKDHRFADFDPFIAQQNEKKSPFASEVQQFQLKLPKKITNKNQIQVTLNKQQQKVEDAKINKFSQKVEPRYQCPSPKYSASPKILIDKNVLSLLEKKQNKIEQEFYSEILNIDCLLKDHLVSPRTHANKKKQIQQKFVQTKETIRSRVEQAIKQAVGISIQKQQSLKTQKNQEQIYQEVHQNTNVIEYDRNMDLNSHRSSSNFEKDSQSFDSQNSQNSQHSQNNQNIVQRPNNIQNSEAPQNSEVIRIFTEIYEHHIKQDEPQRQILEEPEPQKVGYFKGLETTLLFIKQYCVSFIEFIRSSPIHSSSFVQNICMPIEYDSLQLLKTYRTTMTHQNDTSYNSVQKDYLYPFFKLIYPQSHIITREAFIDFNQTYQKLQGPCEYLTEREIFLNSILDAFNQSLDYKRPCSVYGESPQWISESRTLKNYSLSHKSTFNKDDFIGSDKFDQICGVSIARVIDWATSLCGFIPESPQMQNVVVEEEQINHIRETRIALMLQKDLLESEEGMLDFLIEQTETKLHLGEIIMSQLINEFSIEFQHFFK